MEYYEAYLTQLASLYPKTSNRINLHEKVSPTLISPRILVLPSAIREKAESIVRAFSDVRELRDRNSILEALHPQTPDPGNYSALMSYDFHSGEGGELKLIEINTNASSGLIMDASYKARNIPQAFTEDFRKEILKTFEEEFQRFAPGKSLKSIAIVDEAPEQQRLYVEFLLYQEMFEAAGYSARILDPAQLKFENGKLVDDAGRNIDLVYNRHTDFYFEEPAQRAMRDAFLSKAACFSPNPHEYRLLADKERLLELSSKETLEALAISSESKAAIRDCLLETHNVKSLDPEQLWSDRKNWFFKPRRSFGGKAVYRGASISRPMFTNVLSGDFVAQKIAPPPTVTFDQMEYKFDLRFYVYRDRIQLASARLYQGQMTNARTPGGGATPIRWI